MADNEKAVIEAQLNIDDVNVDKEALSKALSEVQSAMQKNQGKINGIRTRLNASKRYKGRAQDQRDLEGLLKEQSNLAIREGQISAQMAKKVPVSGDMPKDTKQATALRKWREQISREESLKWDKQKEAARLEQQKTLETAKLEGKIQQEQLKNKGRLEVQTQKDKAAAERQAEAQRAAAERHAAWIEIEKEKEVRRNRALDLREKARGEAKTKSSAKRTVENLLNRVRKSFSNGVIGKFGEKLYNTLFSRMARRLLSAIFNSAKTGLQDLYKWSQGNNGLFANAVDRIKEDIRYVSDIIGSVLGPFIEVMAPHIRNIADAFAVAAEKANQFFATLLGRNGYYKAIRVAQQYAGLQNQLLGFDELNVLKGDNDTGGGMFEWKPWDGGELTKTGQRLLKSSKAMLAIGGILMVTGHPVLGAGLIAGGIITGFAASQEGTDLQKKIQDTLDTIGATVAIYGPYAMAIGALLTFSGHPGVGIPIMLTTLAAGAVSWNSIVDLMRGPIGLLTGLVGAASLAIGAVIAFGSPEPRSKAIGVALMAAGAASLVSAVALNWDSIVTSLKNVFQAIWLSIKGTALVALGLVLAFSGVGVPLGISLIQEGMSAFKQKSEINWGADLKKDIETNIDEIGKSGETKLESWASRWKAKADDIGNRWRNIWYEVNGLSSLIEERTQKINQHSEQWKKNHEWYIDVEGNAVIRGYASGGTPQTGSLFYAGEAGPELVTSMNGQSTVYNENQLAGSLASANTGVVNAVYAMADAVVSAINRKDLSISSNDMRNSINGINMRYGV